jgi:hypothetical protein
MSLLFGLIGPFAAGMVVAINLNCLIETSPNYDAAWWRVGLAVFMAIGCWVMQKK